MDLTSPQAAEQLQLLTQPPAGANNTATLSGTSSQGGSAAAVAAASRLLSVLGVALGAYRMRPSGVLSEAVVCAITVVYP